MQNTEIWIVSEEGETMWDKSQGTTHVVWNKAYPTKAEAEKEIEEYIEDLAKDGIELESILVATEVHYTK